MNKTDMVEGAENGRCAKQPMRCEQTTRVIRTALPV